MEKFIVFLHGSKPILIHHTATGRVSSIQGNIVLRFSGSEIFSHVDICVNEVMQFLKKK